MAALTRIFNNQIYNNTIVGYQKIAPGTLTGSLFASNVTVPGDLLIAGNLFVLGSSSSTTIASTNTYVNDPMVLLNNGFSGTNTRDIGLVLNRGTDQNQAIIWSEVFKEFRLVSTNDEGVYGNLTATGLARLSVGSLNVPGQANIGTLAISGAITGSSLNVTGNVLAQAGVLNALTVNGNETITGFINVTGNVLASQARLNYLDVNGNVDLGQAGAVSGSWVNISGNITQTSSGGAVYFNTTGNISTAQLNAGQINTTGNVLGQSGTFNALTVNGNESVTGFLNVTGNVLGAAATFSSVLSSGVINTAGNVLATGGVFNALTVNGNESVTGYLNVTGNVMTAQLNAGQINTTGNVLAQIGTFNSLTVNGNETVTGYLNVTGNILASQGRLNYLDVNGNVDVGLAGAVSGSWINVIGNITQTSSGGAVYFNTAGNILTASLSAGQINTTGNVLAQAGIFNAVTVNGNETVTGYLNVTGNILGATGTLSVLGVSNTLWANSSTATTTQGTGALIIPTGGISVAGAANIAGSITTAGAAQFNNTVTIGGITSHTNTTNATALNTGALQIAGGASISKDLWVGGNIYASNIFGVTHQVITVKDPLVYFDAANTFPYNYDIGFYSNFVGPNPVDNTGNVYQHSGIVRDDTDSTWKFFSNVRTEPTGSTVSFDVNTIYDPVKAGNLQLVYTQAAISTTTGALQVAGGAGIAGTVVAGQINSTGNVLGQAGTFNALTVNGTANINTVSATSISASTATIGGISAVTIGNSGATVTGTTGTFGAVNAGFIGNTGTAFTGASLNVTANVLAAAGTFNALTVNGNETVTGFLNVTGNVLASQARFNYMDVNGNVDIGAAGAISGSWINVIGNITQSSSGGAVYFNTAGNVMAAVGQFGAINSTGFINTTGNISTAQLNAGQINTTGNVLASTVRASFVTTNTAVAGNISAVTIGNSGATVTGTTGTFGAVNAGFIGNTGTAFTGASVNLSGNLLASSATMTTLTVNGNVLGGLADFAALNATPVGNATPDTGAFTTLSASQGIWANSTTASTTTTTGAIVVAGGIGLAGNIRAGGGAVINNNQTADPFQVKGVATTSLIYADTAFGAVVIGGSNTATPKGSTLKVNGTDSMMVPVGTTGQRPGLTGNIDLVGMMRFNTTINNLEFFDGTQWNTPGGVFTVISDRQFAGNVGGSFGNVDGTNTTFTIQSPSTTSATIVSINGVIQFPVLAYSVSGTTLTFAEPPAPDDVIDVRVLTTSVTVGSLANGNGTNQIFTEDNGIQLWTGTSTTVEQILINTVGDVNLLNNNKLTYTQVPVNIAANNTPYVIATYSQTAYTTAKFLISAKKDTTNFQSMEALITTDGQGNAYVATYGVVSNGTSMGGLTAGVVGGNVELYWTTTTNIINANVKVFGTYIV